MKYNPVYKVDERGITTVQFKNSRIVTINAKKQLIGVITAERGVLVTVIFCMIGDGRFTPPLFVFSIKNMKAELLDEASADSHKAIP